MKPLVIYHANCADGYGAAFAAWLALGDETEYLPIAHNKLPSDEDFLTMIKDREVYMLDFSLPRLMMDVMFERADHVIWLDHHKTAFDMWCPGETQRWISAPVNNQPDILLDNNKSGAYLAWEYFHPNTDIPILIRHIDDYDRWQFKLMGTNAFNKALWSYAPWTFDMWDSLLSQLDIPKYAQMFEAEGHAILRAHNQNVQTIVKGAARECVIPLNYPKDIQNPNASFGVLDYHSEITLPGLAATCPHHLASDVGHELATTSNTFGLLWSITKDGTCSCSLRSNGDYDVSAIAKAFGGGGHKNAAGFEIDIQTLLTWIK